MRSPSPPSSRWPGGVEGYEFQRLHGMGEALYEAVTERQRGHRLPHLRAGRRPSRPARLSRPPASRERRQFLLRRGRRRPIGAGRRRCSSARRRRSPMAPMRAIAACPCRGTFTRRRAATPPASNSAQRARPRSALLAGIAAAGEAPIAAEPLTAVAAGGAARDSRQPGRRKVHCRQRRRDGC